MPRQFWLPEDLKWLPHEFVTHTYGHYMRMVNVRLDRDQTMEAWKFLYTSIRREGDMAIDGAPVALALYAGLVVLATRFLHDTPRSEFRAKQLLRHVKDVMEKSQAFTSQLPYEKREDNMLEGSLGILKKFEYELTMLCPPVMIRK